MAQGMQGDCEGPLGQKEDEIITVMWKVLVAICIVGQPCTLFEEDPMKYYHTEKECMIASEAKSRAMVQTFNDFGYHIDSEAHSCQYIVIKNEA